MPELNVQQKVIAFVQQNPQYEGKSAESVLSAMLASGEITQTEIDRLKTGNTKSAFGFGFETDYLMDMSFERAQAEQGEISTTPTTQTQKRTADFVQKRYGKAQADFDKQMLEDGCAGDVADKFSVIWGSDNRAKKVREDLKIASLQAEQLKIAAEESSDAFKAKFKEIYGIDYNAQNIEAFERDEKAYLEALDAKNKEDAFNQHFDKLLNEDLADEFKTVGGGNSGATQTVRIPKEEIYEQEFKKLAEMFGEGGEEFLNEYIKQAQAEDFAVDAFSAGTGTVEYKWNLLKKLVQGMSQRFATETAKACNGSDIESLEKRYENSYKSAFGNNNDIQKRVNDYNISQQKGAGIVKTVVPMAIMLAISIGTMGTGSAAALPAVAGAAGATGAGATSAVASGSILLSIAKSAVTIAGLSAGVEITDRFTSGAALKSLREEGFLEYLETASQMTDWSQVAKASVSAGAMCVVFGGVSYAVSNLTRVAGTALKMSELGIACASVATTSASTVATGLGVEYLMTGEISVEGIIFTVTMAVIGGVTQVMQIKRAAPQFEQMREQLKTDGEYALKILDFQPGEEVTLETIKAHTMERAMKYLSSSNSTPERQYMQLQFIQASHDLLTANIVEIQNLLKTGGINLAVAQQNFTYNYSPSTTQTYPQISAPQMGLTTPQNQVSLAIPQAPSIAIQTGISTIGQTPQPAIAGLGYGIVQNSAPEYVPPQVSTVEITSQADLCVSEGVPSSNSICFTDKLKLALNFKGRKLKEDFLKTSLHSLSNNDKLLAEHFIDKALIAGLNIESFKYDIEEYIKLANNTNNPKDTINTIADFYIKFKSDDTKNLRKWHAICDQYLFSTENDAISSEVGLSFMKAINESNITSSQIKMIITQGKPDNKIQPWESLHIQKNFNNSDWETLIKILPAIKDLPAKNLGEIDFINLIKIAQVPKYFNALSINNRLSVAENIDKIPIEIQKKLAECELDVQGLKAKLLNNSKVTGFEVNANPELQKAFFRNVINNNSEVESVIRNEDFNKFLQTHKNQGLPLKYSRTQFNQDLKNLLNQLPENDKIKVLQQLNISLTDSSFEGFVKLNPLELNNFSSKSQNIIKQINNCLENFGKNNEIQCDNPEIKRLLDSIIQGFPEFLSIIGKQDAIHPNKLDIHILETLYNALNHPNYSKLNDSDKTTLKLAILMHDIGKVEGVNGPHSDQSTIYANNILSKFNLGQNTKENIIELIRFHHFTTEKYDYPINVGVEHIANILADCDYKARFDKSTTIQSSVVYPKNNYQHAKYKTDHALNTPEETYIIYERKLSNGRVIKAQIADMRNTSVHESARNYGWSAAGDKKLNELIVLSHNCQGIEKVRNLLEAYENPLHDFVISAHSSPFIDLWNKYESQGEGLGFSLLLSAPDHHIGKAESSGQVSGRKKGRENFVMNTEEQDPQKLAQKRDNETTVLKPKVERIVILDDITPDKIPDDLIQLSEKYNVPIIIYGKKYRNW